MYVRIQQLRITYNAKYAWDNRKPIGVHLKRGVPIDNVDTYVERYRD